MTLSTAKHRSQTTNLRSTMRRGRPAFSLLLAALSIMLVWCWILPWLSARPSISHRLQFLDQRGIDPSAMYYTELAVMEPILERIDGR